MSRGPWKRPKPDEYTVEYVPITDEVQIERWYEPWRILIGAFVRMQAEQKDTPLED